MMVKTTPIPTRTIQHLLSEHHEEKLLSAILTSLQLRKSSLLLTISEAATSLIEARTVA
jgi:hypothetical protein